MWAKNKCFKIPNQQMFGVLAPENMNLVNNTGENKAVKM